jgi:predicted 3-demethylubiquinone-9 3-methyltransferase (glyoxalase superfamily)
MNLLPMPHKITPFIRCNSEAKQQAEFYCDIFPDAHITDTNPIVTTFEIFWSSLATINGGEHPGGKLNPSISFSLWITDADETKRIRDLLADGGSVMMPFQEYERSPAYGWCNDTYGVSRQVMYDNRPESTANALVPSLMYTGANNGKTAEAMEFYTKIFPSSKIDFTRPYGENAMGENPTHLNHAEFKLVNQQFIAMDSGMDHAFTFNDGISLSVSCANQTEVDTYRNALIADWGQEVQCGRCKDKYGVSRQIIPVQLQEALSQSDTDKSTYAMDAMLKMKKIIITDLYQS